MLSTTFSSEPRKNDVGAHSVRPASTECGGERAGEQCSPLHTAPGNAGAGHGGARPYLTLFKKDLTRFWPLWAAYTVLWSLLIPLEVFNRSERLARTYAQFNMTGWAGDYAMSTVCQLDGSLLFNGPMFSAVYGVLCAMAVWSYLYSARSANLTHALPVRREGQFAAHFLAGTTFFVLPHAVVAVLTLIAGLATGSRGDLANILAAMGILTLLCLFFFSLATLCAFITGHILALPAFYLIVNFLAYGVSGLLDWLAARFLFGFTTALRGSELVGWLTPAARLARELGWGYDYTYDGVTHTSYRLNGIPQPENGTVSYTVTTHVEGLDLVFIYTAAALVLTALALLLYRRRHLETAGDVVAVSWLKPVFQYGVAFCTALAGAYILADILNRRNRLLLAVLLVACSVIGYFAARMLLHKSLKVFKSGWKGALIVPAVIVVLCLGLELDVLGVERKLPGADQVVSVWVRGPDTLPGDSGNYLNLDVEDPALIEKLLSVHQTVIGHRKELKSALDVYWSDASANDLPEDTRCRDFRVEYVLQNGRTLEREYDLVISTAELDDPDSVASALYGLVTDPDFNRLSYGLDDVAADRLTQVLVCGVEGIPEKGQVTFYSPLSELAGYDISQDDSDPVPIGGPAEGPVAETRRDDGVDYRPASLEELAALFRTVEADFNAGNLGRRWLFAVGNEFNAKTCFASLEFYWNEKHQRADGGVFYNQRGVYIQLTPQATDTLAALEELGLFENGAFITDYDNEQVWPR